MDIDRVIRIVYERFKNMILNDYNIENVTPFLIDCFEYGEIVSHMRNSSLYENVSKNSGVFCQYRPIDMVCDEWNLEKYKKIAKNIVGDHGVVGNMSESNIIQYGEPSKEGSHYQKDMHRKMVENRFVPAVQYSAGEIKNVLYPLAEKQNTGWKRTSRGIFQYHGSDIQKCELPRPAKQKKTIDEKWPYYGKWFDELYEAQEGICYLCGKKKDKDDLVIDHILPKKRKGLDNPDNLQLTCSRCNTSKGSKTVQEHKGLGHRKQIAFWHAKHGKDFVERKRYDNLVLEAQELKEKIRELETEDAVH